MIQYIDALRQLRASAGERAANLETETLSLAPAVGRVLSQAIRSSEYLPAFDNSAVDGFAVVAADLAHASRSQPVELAVAGTIAAGDPPPAPDARDETARRSPPSTFEIMTGAALPGTPWDSVVKVEEVERIHDPEGRLARVRFVGPVTPGEFVRRRGTDITPDQVIGHAGTRFTRAHVLAAAALGIPAVEVRRRPVIAYLSTGAELVPHDTPSGALRAGGIRNSTAPYLESALRALGAKVLPLGSCGDDPAAFTKILADALENGADAILTTGAVSMGKFDFVPQAAAQLGFQPRFHKVAIRPGKPIFFAERGKTVLFGVPGNPVSTAVALRFFVEPYLRALQGLAAETPRTLKLIEPTSKPEGLRCFLKAETAGIDHAQARVLSGQASFQVESLLRANVWVELPEAGAEFPPGTAVSVWPLELGDR
ncbi:MAG: molybdopterin molybdotransferase MoeA [Bacteriovoracia bacterium]